MLRSDTALSLILATALLSQPASADDRPYYLRNQNPFLQVLGLPAPEGARLVGQDQLASSIAVTLANHADAADSRGESIVLDGESWYVDTRFRYGLGERWEVGVDLPFVAHGSGNLDNLIEGWHDLFGLDNGNRQGPSNHMQLSYRSGETTRIDLRDGSSGLGDVRLTAAARLFESGDRATTLTLRGAVELPTGDEDALRGSGDTDVALGLEADQHRQLAGRELTLQAQLGALRPGDWELFEGRQEELVPYATFGAAWQWRPQWRLRTQLAYQGSYLNSRLDPLGGSTANVAVGAALTLPGIGIEIDLALIEDLISDTTPDFGLYLAVRRTSTGQ